MFDWKFRSLYLPFLFTSTPEVRFHLDATTTTIPPMDKKAPTQAIATNSPPRSATESWEFEEEWIECSYLEDQEEAKAGKSEAELQRELEHDRHMEDRFLKWIWKITERRIEYERAFAAGPWC